MRSKKTRGGHTDEWRDRETETGRDRDKKQTRRSSEDQTSWRRRELRGQSDRGKATRKPRSRELRRGTEMDRKRNRNQTVIKKQCGERLRRTDRQRDEGQCKGRPALTELSAGFLGPLRHLGRSCKAPGQWASGRSRLRTSTSRFLPRLPFPFLAPSRRSLPLCIFKPVKLPQLHPPHPLHRGRGPGPPPFQAPAGCLLGLGYWGGREARGRPQAQGTWRAWGQGGTNHRRWEWSPLGGGCGGEPADSCQGVWPAAGRVPGVRPAHRPVCSKPRCLEKDWQR